MSDKQIKDLALIFKVLSDPIRLKIIKEIVNNPGISGKELMINLVVTQPTLSFHLKQLQSVGLIMFNKDGQTHCYYLNGDVVEREHDKVNEQCKTIIAQIWKNKK